VRTSDGHNCGLLVATGADFSWPKVRTFSWPRTRVAFGFTNFRNYRVRALLYAGKPDWSLLASISPT